MARYSDLIHPRFLRAEEAGHYVGCPGLLSKMEKAGWIKPTVRQKRMTLFSLKKLDECADRLESGEFPQAV
jgi:hypothetical protein